MTGGKYHGIQCMAPMKLGRTHKTQDSSPLPTEMSSPRFSPAEEGTLERWPRKELWSKELEMDFEMTIVNDINGFSYYGLVYKNVNLTFQ